MFLKTIFPSNTSITTAHLMQLNYTFNQTASFFVVLGLQAFKFTFKDLKP